MISPYVHIYCTERGDFEVPWTVVKATHFRKDGGIDRRYANAQWREWLKQIGESN
jgi:hypothetical protein